MDLRKAEYDRAKSLVDSKVGSVQDLDSKKAQYAVAVARWERAKTQRDYAIVRAPFAGVVTEKYARIGQKVIEDGSEPLFKVTATEPLLARVYLPEDWLLRVRLGDKVEVVPDRFPDAKTTGEVQFISPTVDPASGAFQVVVRVRREPGRTVLRPGIAVQVRFPQAPAKASLGVSGGHAAEPSPLLGPPPVDPRPRARARHQEHVVPPPAPALQPRGALGGPRLPQDGARPARRLRRAAGGHRRPVRSSSEDAVLIKVALDLNDLLRKVAERPFRRAGRMSGRRPARLARSGGAPADLGRPLLPRRRGREPRSRTPARRPLPRAACSSAALAARKRQAAPRGRRDHRQRRRDDGRVSAGPPVPALRDHQAAGSGAGAGDGEPDRPAAPGHDARPLPAGGRHARARVLSRRSRPSGATAHERTASRPPRAPRHRRGRPVSARAAHPGPQEPVRGVGRPRRHPRPGRLRIRAGRLPVRSAAAAVEPASRRGWSCCATCAGATRRRRS